MCPASIHVSLSYNTHVTTGQCVMEGFIDLKVPMWARVTFTRLLAIGPGLVVAIFTQNNQSLSDKYVSAVNQLEGSSRLPHPIAC